MLQLILNNSRVHIVENKKSWLINNMHFLKDVTSVFNNIIIHKFKNSESYINDSSWHKYKIIVKYIWPDLNSTFRQKNWNWL